MRCRDAVHGGVWAAPGRIFTGPSGGGVPARGAHYAGFFVRKNKKYRVTTTTGQAGKIE